MPRIGRTVELADAERLLDPEQRYVDLAVCLRVLNEDGTRGRLLPEILGGRWDTWISKWVRRAPGDLKVHEWTIQEQQIDIVTGLPKETMFVAILAGRQAGKSRVGLMEIAKDALRYAGAESFIVSLDFKASREPEEVFRSLLAPWWRVREVKSDRAFVFPHGHRVMFRSAESIDSCRGPSTKAVLLDEASRMSAEVFTAAVGGGAAAKNFRLYLATTPKRECAWIREKVDPHWEGKPGSVVRRLRTEANPRRNHALLERLRDDLPADLYAQEFEGQLVAPADAVYARLLNRKLHLRPEGKLPSPARFGLAKGRAGEVVEPRDWTAQFCQREYGVPARYIAGWDFGREAVVFGKLYREERMVQDGSRAHMASRLRLWLVGELVNYQTTTDHHAQDVIDAWGKEIAIVTDAMGAHDKAAGRGTESAAIEILREAGFASVEPIAKRNPDILQRVRTVQRALRSARRSDDWPETDEWPGGEARLFLVPGACPRTLEALETQRMAHGKPEKDEKHEHVADALGYLVCAVLPIESELPAGFERPFARSD